MFTTKPHLTKPGLFITATDTGVGKTVVTCAIAQLLRSGGSEGAGGIRGRAGRVLRVGVCKPFATGCRHDREGLVGEDAEALAHFADCRQPLAVINPVRYAPPVAPAVAAELTGRPVDFDQVARSLELLDSTSDALLIEGVGGVMVPLARRPPGTPAPGFAPGRPPSLLPGYITVLDLALALGYPVLVVARAGLGTLSHAAMTIALLRQAGCPIAGLVINGYVADPATAPPLPPLPSGEGWGEGSAARDAQAADISMTTNRTWLERMNRVPILGTIPACPAAQVAPAKGQIPPAVFDALAVTYWPDILAAP